jgi:exonuclease III
VLIDPIGLHYTVSMKVLSFNAMMIELPLIGKKIMPHQKIRQELLASQLWQQQADVLLLQEIFSPKLRTSLEQFFQKAGYHVVKHNNRTAFRVGHGLMIISRYPLSSEPEYHPYQKATRLEENFCRKGILSVEVDHPEWGALRLVNTHMGAIYPNYKKNDFQIGHQKRKRKQIEQFLDIIAKHQKKVPCLMGGDFNTHEWKVQSGEARLLCPDYQLLTSQLSFCDSYRAVREDEGHTYDGQHPYNRGDGCHKFTGGGRRLDYIFLAENFPAQVVNSERCFIEPVASKKATKVYLSDHYGLISELGPV